MTSSLDQLGRVGEQVESGVRSTGQIAGGGGGDDGLRPAVEAGSVLTRNTEEVPHHEAGKGLEEDLHDVTAPIVLEHVKTLIDECADGRLESRPPHEGSSDDSRGVASSCVPEGPSSRSEWPFLRTSPCCQDQASAPLQSRRSWCREPPRRHRRSGTAPRTVQDRDDRSSGRELLEVCDRKTTGRASSRRLEAGTADRCQWSALTLPGVLTRVEARSYPNEPVLRSRLRVYHPSNRGPTLRRQWAAIGGIGSGRIATPVVEVAVEPRGGGF